MKEDMVIRSWREEQTISERRRMRRGLAPVIVVATVVTMVFAIWKGCGMKSIMATVYAAGAGWLFLETCITLNWVANTKRLSPLSSFLLSFLVVFFVAAIISVVMLFVFHFCGIWV